MVGSTEIAWIWFLGWLAGSQLSLFLGVAVLVLRRIEILASCIQLPPRASPLPSSKLSNLQQSPGLVCICIPHLFTFSSATVLPASLYYCPSSLVAPLRETLPFAIFPQLQRVR